MSANSPASVEATAPGPKVDPETLAIRARPQRAIRFRRGVIIGIAAFGSVSLIGVAWMALKPKVFVRVADGSDLSEPTRAASDAVTRAKPRDKQYKLADGHGLYLLVTPQGGRYWRMNYRFDGKAKTMALGVFPLVTLAEAREKREEARKLLAARSDPTAKRKEVEAHEAFETTTASCPGHSHRDAPDDSSASSRDAPSVGFREGPARARELRGHCREYPGAIAQGRQPAPGHR